jgi:hypothetical protein
MVQNIGKHFLYRHIRVDKNEPFYIGIGVKKKLKYPYSRAYSKHDRNNIWKRIVFKTEYEVEILLESDDYEFIKEKEREFIKLYGRKDLKTGSLCNLTDGGEGCYNRIMTKECKDKISKSLKGKPFTEERKKNVSVALCKLNLKVSDETKRKLSIAHKGKKLSLETIQKVLITKKLNKPNRKVYQYDKAYNFIKEWNSIAEASKESNTDLHNLYVAINKENQKRKSAGGFIWSYEKE